MFYLNTGYLHFLVISEMLLCPQDFTVFGGSLSGAHAQKICKVRLVRFGSDLKKCIGKILSNSKITAI